LIELYIFNSGTLQANFIFRRLQINWLISTVGGIGFKPLRVYPPFNWVVCTR
jgi:hypothetical protein